MYNNRNTCELHVCIEYLKKQERMCDLNSIILLRSLL